MRDRRRTMLISLAGLFLLCMVTLMLQIVETRLISVIAWYYLAFFAVSMAMLGMTAGSLIVYFRPRMFTEARLLEQLAWTGLGLAAAIVVSALALISSVVPAGFQPASLMRAFLWLELILLVAPPYVLAGMATSLALTRSPWSAGLVYGTDMLGAAAGCLAALAVLTWMDAVSALFVIAALAALSSACFAAANRQASLPLAATTRPPLRPMSPVLAAAVLVGAAWLNIALQPAGLGPILVKDKVETSMPVAQRWNSFSRVRIEAETTGNPAMWGPSPHQPAVTVKQRYINIDGAAGTAMYRFDGDLKPLGFLGYDITSLAYRIRKQGRAAVIGVGGGRDLLTAHLFGFGDVTGIEVNPIFVDWLTGPFRDYNRLADLPGTRLIVDDGRSWFARTTERFGLIQMSLIDTWAATGAGALSMSENGLYTVQAWQHFLRALAPDGVFTVSRWYDPGNISEASRLLSLAVMSLRARGVADPAAHIYLAASERLATLIVAAAPFAPGDLAGLHEATATLGFVELASPGHDPASPLMTDILAADGNARLAALSAEQHIDITAPTDDRPFFFNQLLLGDPLSLQMARNAGAGVLRGNLEATETVGIIVLLSAILVAATLVLPGFASVRRVPPRFAVPGTLYFACIGLGFMFVEIGIIQRISIILGHPVYGLAIGLFGLILATGVGSLLSERVRLVGAARFACWAAALSLFVAGLPLCFAVLAGAAEGYGLPVRIMASLAAIVPAGVLMGFAFPAGLRLVRAVDSRPIPWFWAVNGACGVLGAGLAVAVGLALSVSAALWFGAACYALAGALGCVLQRLPTEFVTVMDRATASR